jgi:uncharacterized membrane protein YuzA (DUF378 family)
MVVYDTQEVVEDVNVTPGGDVVKTTRRVAPAPVPDEHPQQAFHTKKTIFRSYQIIWYIVGFIEVLLIFRVFLKLFGANTASGFTDLIYALSYPFAAPFINVFGVPRGAGYVLETGTVLGMIVYFILGFAIERLLNMVKPVNPEEVDRAVSV